LQWGWQRGWIDATLPPRPCFVHTDFAESMTNLDVKAQIVVARDKMAISPAAIARAIAFAIEQPADIDVGEVVIRPTAQI
jgi:NADP-dependent 3-hydroxy acid dehydrogenase YdfG